MTRVTVVLIVWMVFLSSVQSQIQITPERASLIDSVSKTLHQYYDDIRAKGLLAEFAYLDNSPEFFWVPPGYSMPISYDSVVSAIKINAAIFVSVNNSWDSLRIIPLSDTLAMYTGTLHSVMTDTSGKVTNVSLIETGLMIKRRDGWKLFCGQTSMLTK